MKYCPYCQRMVNPVGGKFHWVGFLVLLIVFFPLAILYAVAHAMFWNPKYCPICGGKVAGRAPGA
ncbi:MAG: hypothetical protein ABSC17_11470 [Thermacetogeniaceae bacterium]